MRNITITVTSFYQKKLGIGFDIEVRGVFNTSTLYGSNVSSLELHNFIEREKGLGKKVTVLSSSRLTQEALRRVNIEIQKAP